MARTHDSQDWSQLGPVVLQWLAQALPLRRSLHGVWFDCAAAFGHAFTPDSARIAITREPRFRVEWLRLLAANKRPIPTTAASDPPAPPTSSPASPPSAPPLAAPALAVPPTLEVVPQPVPVPPSPLELGSIQEVTKKETDGGIEARSNGRTIRTVEDLIAYIEVDMTRFDIASSEATKYEGLTKDAHDNPVVTEMFRVFVRLKPKMGPNTREMVDAMLAGAFKAYQPRAVAALPTLLGDLLQLIVVADPHLGKRSWRRSTGGPDYDLPIGVEAVRQTGHELVALGDAKHPVRRLIALLGDYFHYDTPQGTTTSGTPLDYDGRIQKMIEMGTDAVIDLIETSAATCPTDVYIIPGNHDESLTWALQRILRERFRLDGRVTMDDGFTQRKYVPWGKNLIGFAHGEKAKKKLPQIMALEAAEDWGRTTYREIHTGHLHYTAAEWQRPIETIDGVIVRIAPSLAPPDDWHSTQGFIGATRAMESFFYREQGGLAAMLVSMPTVPASD